MGHLGYQPFLRYALGNQPGRLLNAEGEPDARTFKTAGMLMHCDIALNVLALFAYELRQCALLCCFALLD